MSRLAPPYDREVMSVIAATGAAYESIDASMIAELRKADLEAPSFDKVIRNRAVAVEDHRVSAEDGYEIAVTVLRPANGSGPGSAHPGVLFIHGGGMISGNRRSEAETLCGWVERHQVVIASVEYRLAPEYPGTYPVTDCHRALQWFHEHSDRFGVDPSRLVVAGVSAGGGLAAGVALIARDTPGPALAGQMLLSPMLDDRNNSVSSAQFSRTGLWDRESNETGWTALLGPQETRVGVSPSVSPARADDLSDLPATFLDVGAAEIFRDEVVSYASMLWAHGVDAELHVWPGGCHGFQYLAPAARLSVEAARAQDAWLSRLIGA